jgi:hypothetical protein
MLPPFGDTGGVTESRPPEARPGRAPRRRERIDDVFGEVLPETTSDERTRESTGGSLDSWYLENRPPHHDR